MAHTVEDIQRQLKAKGFDPGLIDGKFGMLTQGAIKRFQKSRNLAETGSLNPFTEEALFGTPARPPSLIGGIFSAIFSKETGMQRYSKLIAAVGGNILGAVIAIVLGYLATLGLATCSGMDTSTGQQVCTIAGHSQSEITAWLMGIIMIYVNGQAVKSAPANKPPS